MLLKRRTLGTQKLRAIEVINSPYTDYDAKVEAAAKLERLLKGQEVARVGVDKAVFERYLLPTKIDRAASVPEVENLLEKAFGWTVDFTGIEEELAKRAGKHLTRLSHDYPLVSSKLKYVGTYAGEKTPYYVKLKFDYNEYAHAVGFDSLDPRIALNPNWWGDQQKFITNLQLDVLLKWHPRGCDAPESVLTHEWGHLVDSWLAREDSAFLPYVDTISGFGLVEATWHRLQELYKPTAELSRYALTKDGEAVAEAFAAIYHSPQPKDDFVQRVKTFLDIVKNEKWYNKNEYKWLYELSGEERTKANELFRKYEELLGYKWL